MVTTLRRTVTVQRGGVIKIRARELKAGTRAKVIVSIEGRPESRGGEHRGKQSGPDMEALSPKAPRLREPFRTLLHGPKPGCFSSAAEVDAYIRQERDSWGL